MNIYLYVNTLLLYICVCIWEIEEGKVSVSKDALFFARNLSNDSLKVHKVSDNQPVLTLYLSIEPKYNWVKFLVQETKCFNICALFVADI